MKSICDLFRKPVSYNSLALIVAFYFCIVLNLPLWRDFEEIFRHLEKVNIGFVISLPIFIVAALNIIFQIFSWPYLARPFFSLLIFMSSIVAYAMYSYGVIFDYTMIENIFETNSGEALSYLSVYSVCVVFIIGVLPSITVLNIKINHQETWLKLLFYKLISIILSVIVIIIIALFFYKDYASVGRNNKYLNRAINPSYVYTAVKYIDHTYFSRPIPYKQIGIDAKQSKPKTPNQKPTLFVFVLGETARSQNYQSNDYSRPTNQYTKNLGMISFRNVRSCGTATAVSVPCMFSNMNRVNYNKQKAYSQDNFIDVLDHAGVAVFWNENDGGDKGVADRIDKFQLKRNSSNPLCDDESCLDMALLNNFDTEVSNMKGNKFITFHIMGSHGPTYYKRYPKSHAFFKPDCQRADIENCTDQQIVNSYDNTILYTDYFISQLISKLKVLSDQYNTALFYISDHGESLGESGLYLHGTPYSLAPKYQTTVPMMVWFSKGFIKDRALNISCLKNEARNGHFSQDNVFSSMLGIMNIRTSVYNPTQDIFRKCRTN